MIKAHVFADMQSAADAVELINEHMGYPKDGCETRSWSCVDTAPDGTIYIMADDETERILGAAIDYQP